MCVFSVAVCVCVCVCVDCWYVRVSGVLVCMCVNCMCGVFAFVCVPNVDILCVCVEYGLLVYV